MSAPDSDMIVLKVKESQRFAIDTVMTKVLNRVPWDTSKVTWCGPTQEVVITLGQGVSADAIMGMLFPQLDDYVTAKIVVRGIEWHYQQLSMVPTGA